MVNYSFSMSELEYFLFVLVRVSAFIFVAPFFSTKGVPNNVKIGLSVFVTYIKIGRASCRERVSINV